MKTAFSKIALVLSVICIIAFASPVGIYASSLDELLGDGNTTTSSDDGSNGNVTVDNGEDYSISDYMRGYNPISSENMQQASKLATPVANVIGTITGFIMIITVSFIFLTTALDLLYIAFPPIRPRLNPEMGQASGGGMGMPMGGMGMGMRGGMMGGMGAPAGGGAAPMQRRWVSDEAVAAVAMANPAPQGGGMMGGMGGMGMMGGMGAAPQPAMSTKSVIGTYFKKRIFFVIIFACASVVLMSSILLDCGINLAELLLKIFEKLNGSIANQSFM